MQSDTRVLPPSLPPVQPYTIAIFLPTWVQVVPFTLHPMPTRHVWTEQSSSRVQQEVGAGDWLGPELNGLGTTPTGLASSPPRRRCSASPSASAELGSCFALDGIYWRFWHPASGCLFCKPDGKAWIPRLDGLTLSQTHLESLLEAMKFNLGSKNRLRRIQLDNLSRLIKFKYNFMWPYTYFFYHLFGLRSKEGNGREMRENPTLFRYT